MAFGRLRLQPGGISRRVVDVEAWPLRQPGADLSLRGTPAVYGVLVSAVVVDYQVHVELVKLNPASPNYVLNRVSELLPESGVLLMPCCET